MTSLLQLAREGNIRPAGCLESFLLVCARGNPLLRRKNCNKRRDKQKHAKCNDKEALPPQRFAFLQGAMLLCLCEFPSIFKLTPLLELPLFMFPLALDHARYEKLSAEFRQ